MKKIYFIVVTVVLCSLVNVYAGEIRMIDRTGYGYTVDGKHYSYNLYYDEDTGYPLFRLDYGTEYEEGFFFRETNEQILSTNELNKIKDDIFYITDGRKFSELSMTELIGIQALIWDVYSTHTDKVLEWTCDTGFLVDYLPKMADKKREYETPQVYNYETVVNRSLKIDFLPFFKSAYNITNNYKDTALTKDNNSLTFVSKEVGDYTYEVDSKYFHEDVSYYKGEYSFLIELKKHVQPKPIINISVLEEPKKEGKINVIDDEGIESKLIKETFYEGEDVRLSYTLKDGYTLEKVLYITDNGTYEIERDHFTFLGSGTIHFITKYHKTTYNINVVSSKNVVLNINSTGKEKEKVTFTYNIVNDYVIDYIGLIYDNKSKRLDMNEFIMPSSDVTIHFVLKSKQKNIFNVYNLSSAEVTFRDLASSYKMGDKVLLIPNTNTFNMVVYDELGNIIEVKDNTFIMPSSDIYITATDIKTDKSMKEKNAKEELTNTTLVTKDNTLDDVPKTGDISNDYSFLPLLVMLGGLLGLKYKFYRKA